MSFYQTFNNKTSSQQRGDTSNQIQTAKIFSILAKRQRQTLCNFKNQWPGARKPSFGSLPHTKSRKSLHSLNPAVNKKLYNAPMERYQHKTSVIPVVQSSKKFISLFPTQKNSLYTNTRNSEFENNIYIRHQSFSQVKNCKSMNKFTSNAQKMFKNVSITKKLSKQNLHKKRKRSFNQQKFEKITNNTIQSRQNQNQDEKQQRKKRLKDYVIDFQAFNYISKIIDSPDPKLWAKFIHIKR